MERGEYRLPEEELARPAAVLAQFFIQRWDVHAQQLDEGRYVCLHEQLNVSSSLCPFARRDYFRCVLTQSRKQSPVCCTG